MWFKKHWESPPAIHLPLYDLPLSAIGAKFLSVVKHLWKCEFSRRATPWAIVFKVYPTKLSFLRSIQAPNDFPTSDYKVSLPFYISVFLPFCRLRPYISLYFYLLLSTFLEMPTCPTKVSWLQPVILANPVAPTIALCSEDHLLPSHIWPHIGSFCSLSKLGSKHEISLIPHANSYDQSVAIHKIYWSLRD